MTDATSFYTRIPLDRQFVRAAQLYRQECVSREQRRAINARLEYDRAMKSLIKSESWRKTRTRLIVWAGVTAMMAGIAMFAVWCSSL